MVLLLIFLEALLLASILEVGCKVQATQRSLTIKSGSNSGDGVHLVRRSPSPMHTSRMKWRKQFPYQKLGKVGASTSSSSHAVSSGREVEMSDRHEIEVGTQEPYRNRSFLLDRLLLLRTDIDALSSLRGFDPYDIVDTSMMQTQAELQLMRDMNKSNKLSNDGTDSLLCDIRDGEEIKIPVLQDETCNAYRANYECLIERIKKGLNEHSRSKATPQQKKDIMRWAREANEALSMLRRRFHTMFTEAMTLKDKLEPRDLESI